MPLLIVWELDSILKQLTITFQKIRSWFMGPSLFSSVQLLVLPCLDLFSRRLRRHTVSELSSTGSASSKKKKEKEKKGSVDSLPMKLIKDTNRSQRKRVKTLQMSWQCQTCLGWSSRTCSSFFCSSSQWANIFSQDNCFCQRRVYRTG